MTRATPDLLRQVPIFASLSDDQLQNMIDSPNNGVVDFKPNQDVIREDEIGDCMYIILEGVVDVRIRTVGGRDITIATLKDRDFFGEQALLPGTTGKRNATVRALKPCRMFKISKQDVSLGISKDEELGPIVEDLSEASDEDRVRMMLRSVRLFRALSKKDLARVSEWTEVVRYEAGDMIVRETDTGDYMYVILEGSVDVFVIDDEGKLVVLATLSKGHYFGEQALLPDNEGHRNANVRANGDVTLIRVAKRYFQLIVTHDDKLMLALQSIGSEQQKKIEQAIGRHDDSTW
ncbi:MAG: cyclic nucleotide-binding domain-containing protein [Gammaproteobacteria bacterium]|nr:cyclic nucleotide-binding domain-containing protein [Gammaproteobacteria bacterium]